MVLNMILAATAFMASGYSLSLMCLLRRLRRDPRPAAAAVFVLLAFGLMQFTWALSAQSPGDHAIEWVIVDFLIIALIWWLVVRSAIYFRRRN